MPQKPPLYTDHNVDEYLTYCAKLRLMDTKKIKAAVELAKERTCITHFSKRLIKNLSGGYQQRVGIAQAIVHNPKFIVLDEPTNGLDPNQILEIRALIKEISENHSVLLSTHILSEVEAICDNIKMIEHGNLVFSGTMDDFNQSVKPNTFILRLDNPPLEEQLAKIEHVVRIKSIGENAFRGQISAEEKLSLIAAECVKNNWGLREIMMEKISLDEIFAQLSGKRTINKFEE